MNDLIRYHNLDERLFVLNGQISHMFANACIVVLSIVLNHPILRPSGQNHITCILYILAIAFNNSKIS